MSFTSVTIVGAGPVACGIAVAIARVEVPVTIARAARGEMRLATRRVERRLKWHLDGGEMSEAERDRARARIDFVSDLSSVGSSDLVIETSFGDLRSRRALLATIERSLSPGAVLATNTDASMIEQMAEVVRRRDQFVTMRFTHPATQTSVVELGFLAETAPGVMGACTTFCSWLRKTAVVRNSDVPPRVGYREFLAGA
ncbi:MAG: 3-hydroxyacyl-CoA dehydrogenase NAD-binding domain-containing protein [Sandaracinus sp.]